MAIELIAKVAPKNDGFTGMVDADQVLGGGASGTLPVACVADDSITYAKMQNVSATNRFLGRDTAGAGNVEEIAAGAARTILNVADGADVTSANAPQAHNHDTDTLQLDGVNSDGGAFSFTTTGAVTFNQNVIFANKARANDDIKIVFGGSEDASIQYRAHGTLGNLQIGIIPNGAGGCTGYISILDKNDLAHANRNPAGASVDPVLRIYSSDSAQANDYVDIYHDQADGVITAGNGNLKLTPAAASNLVLGGLTWPNVDGGANELLQTNGAGVLSWAAAGAGDVTAAAALTDNMIVRGDVAAKAVQTTGISIDDTNNILMPTSAAVQFRDANQKIYSSVAGRLDVSTNTSMRFNVAGSWEAKIYANHMDFNNGATVTGLAWVTDGRLDVYVGGALEASFAANKMTFNNGMLTDTGFGWSSNGQLDFRVGAQTEMHLTAKTLTFINPTTDTGIAWGTSARLSFEVGKVERMWLKLSGGGAPELRLATGGFMYADVFVAKATVAAGFAGTYRFGDEVLAPSSGVPSWPLLPAGSWGGTGGWHVVFHGTKKCITPLLEDDS